MTRYNFDVECVMIFSDGDINTKKVLRWRWSTDGTGDLWEELHNERIKRMETTDELDRKDQA